MRHLVKKALLIIPVFVTGCVTVPMESAEKDKIAKEFRSPPKTLSGIYIYRDAFLGFIGGGRGLKKDVYIDDKRIGETAHGVYFYKQIPSGKHKFSTESEFSNNHLYLNTQGGKNYFIEQYIRPGIFVGGANISEVSEEKGKQAVRKLKLAISD